MVTVFKVFDRGQTEFGMGCLGGTEGQIEIKGYNSKSVVKFWVFELPTLYIITYLPKKPTPSLVCPLSNSLKTVAILDLLIYKLYILLWLQN